MRNNSEKSTSVEVGSAGSDLMGKSLVDQLKLKENTYLLILAVIIGLLTGLVTVIFRQLIVLTNDYLFVRESPVLGLPSRLVTMLSPALGGLIVGLLVYRILRLPGGHGVPSVMKAVATGRVVLRPGMGIKSLSSVITMGSGGSAGPEGPVVEIGSVIGSFVGRLARVSHRRLGVLVGCGAASGIAAVFNAPIGGVFFALEIILGDFAIRTFSPVVLSAVTAAVVSKAMLGYSPAFTVPFEQIFSQAHLSIDSLFGLLLGYILLGLLCGSLGAILITTLYRAQDIFTDFKIPLWVKPTIGGLCVGVVGMTLPQVLGEGYSIVSEALSGHFVFWFLAILCVMKILATSLTLGSGGTGGTFAPAMFVGAMGGGALGAIINKFFPGIPALPASFALVGMAGVVAGSLNAPITAILIIFEVTGGDYRVILPLMTTVAISVLVTHSVRKGSVYTLSLLRDGFDVEQAKRKEPLAQVRVREVMRTGMSKISPDMPLPEILQIVADSPNSTFPVIDANEHLVGIISIQDLRSLLTLGEMSSILIARDIADHNPKCLYPFDAVSAALTIFTDTDIEGIPVIDARDPRKIVGILNRQDVFGAYKKAASAQH
jgi:CIC family chloride channel protein